MTITRRALGCVVLAIACSMLAACSVNPLSLGSATTLLSQVGLQPKSAAPAASVPTTPAPTTAKPAPAAPPPTKFAASPAPATFDVLLAPGSWGFHSVKKFETRRSCGVTNALHVDLEQREDDRLTAEQSDKLLDIFEDSKKVLRAIDRAGGDSSDATYTVVTISASDNVGVDTPWVSATLRAGFATADGHKVLECYVYRQKTRFGLDNRPFVSSAIVGYTLGDGTIQNPTRVRL